MSKNTTEYTKSVMYANTYAFPSFVRCFRKKLLMSSGAFTGAWPNRGNEVQFIIICYGVRRIIDLESFKNANFKFYCALTSCIT